MLYIITLAVPNKLMRHFLNDQIPLMSHSSSIILICSLFAYDE